MKRIVFCMSHCQFNIICIFALRLFVWWRQYFSEVMRNETVARLWIYVLYLEQFFICAIIAYIVPSNIIIIYSCQRAIFVFIHTTGAIIRLSSRPQLYYKQIFSNSGFNLQTNFVLKPCFIELSTFHFSKTVKIEICQSFSVCLESLKQERIRYVAQMITALQADNKHQNQITNIQFVIYFVNESLQTCLHSTKPIVQFIPPQMSYHFWTEEESALLVAAVKKYGFRWEEIQFKVFPGLSVAKLKNKFYSDRRFKADAALPLTDEEKLGLKRRKRAPVPVEAKEAPSSEVDVDQLVMALRQMIQ
ncbi:Conserved_hypothetical protein [Hexamita inflata]|uniref:Uncharacterized protein n=2 Tax=Hexamita inflata TaxID=28002 RepID=A0AA86RDT7_9EUKA|nr:Conserved hypothetical protein [Hexamita inflata]CAI9972201.1 Conserved hypothetical protein [Hexamita inflata]